MEKYKLVASRRKVLGKKVKNLRKQGILPANIYGKKVKSVAIELPIKDFNEVFKKAGETGLIELSLEKEIRPVLIHNVQYGAIEETPLHADFLQVDLKQKVTTNVPVELVGESPAVINKVGVLLTLLSEVEIEALPTDLPEKIEIDVSKLALVDQVIKVADIKISDKVKILNDKDTTVVGVAPLVSREAEQMAAEEAAKAAESAAAESSATAGAEGGVVKKEGEEASKETNLASEKKEEKARE